MSQRGDAAYLPQLAKERWALVLDQAPLALAVNTVLTLAVSIVMYLSGGSAFIGLWLAFHVANNGYRYFTVRSHPDHRSSPWPACRRKTYFTLTVSSAFMWGILPFLVADASEGLRLFMYSTVLAMAATTHVTLGGHLKTYTWYVIFMLTPLTTHFLVRGLEETPFLASTMMMLLYSAFLMSSGKMYSKSLSRTLGLSFQNEYLMQKAVASQQALKQSEEQLRRTFEAIGDVVITVNHELAIEYINSAGESLLGLSADDVIGHTIHEVLKLYDDERLHPISNQLADALVFDEADPAKQVDVFNMRCRLKTTGKDFLADIELSAAAIKTAHGGINGYILTLHDTSEIHQLRRHMSWQANHDPLTALYNRREFESRLAGAWYDVLEKGKQHVLCYIDLDNFKQVNDSAGHTAGDAVLVKVAQMMQSKTRNSDMLARLGGDEFGLILYNCDLEGARQVMSNFHASIIEKLRSSNDTSSNIGMSIGISLLSDDYENLETVVLAADQACYTAKQLGRNQISVAPPPSFDATTGMQA